MKTLVVYYSLTGNTKGVAQYIAKRCHADIEQIVGDQRSITDRNAGIYRSRSELGNL